MFYNFIQIFYLLYHAVAPYRSVPTNLYYTSDNEIRHVNKWKNVIIFFKSIHWLRGENIGVIKLSNGNSWWITCKVNNHIKRMTNGKLSTHLLISNWRRNSRKILTVIWESRGARIKKGMTLCGKRNSLFFPFILTDVSDNWKIFTVIVYVYLNRIYNWWRIKSTKIYLL